MHINASYIAFTFLFVTTLCACGGNTNETAPAITIKKSIRGKKKGRIYEKINVVQIPLTAEENNLHGRVHTVRYRTYKWDGTEKRLADSGYNVYDMDGHLTEQHAWSGKGQRKWQCIYRYDDKGKLVEWNLDMQARGEKDTTTFFYNAAGNKVRAVTRANDILRSGKKEYRYDGMGNETEVMEYNHKGSMRRHIRSRYDKKGNQLMVAELFPDGTPYVARQADYDAYGSITSLTLYLGDSLSSRKIMVNDARGKHIEIRSLGADSVYQGKSVYAYDTAGNMLEHKTYRAANGQNATSHVVFEYKYDTAGNITRQTASAMEEGKRVPKEYIEYEYTYYP